MYNGSWNMVTKLDNTWMIHNQLRKRWPFFLKSREFGRAVASGGFLGPENVPFFLKSREFDP